MKWDMAVIRAMLLKMEAAHPDAMLTMQDFDEYEPDVLYEHAVLLEEAGLIDASFVMGPEFRLQRITWQGHDFLGSIRDEGVWKGVQSRLASVGGGASLEVVKALATGLLKAKLGLPES